MEKFEWERLDSHTCRARTPFGWIVLHLSSIARSESMVYIPDPIHVWLNDEEEVENV